MTELKLTRQDVLPEQRGLFRGIAPGKPNAELLVWLAAAEGLATVDDLLAWEHHNQGKGACVNRCGHRVLVGLMDGCRVYCPKCGTHTACSAKDIATGDTPGPVSPGERSQ
jgi:hypothetical protein